ncbi:FtsQ-type POTRA domain-containing protein [Lentilactobacillus senioris]|uniref:cell division protein FtsQ/DivIB n=1 Tax=Lentilactobacillus senioris TaxID=931534 RepID=UPI00228200F8|nr:cell division protein FtsQ/DivIB [Lentilactobacillus senioris]MCY9807610.1 FtsQ-type POTRA domain-containing protein [Lentilactobacillus senioris]
MAKDDQQLTPWQAAHQASQETSSNGKWRRRNSQFKKQNRKSRKSTKIHFLSAIQRQNLKVGWPFVVFLLLLIGVLTYLVLPISSINDVIVHGNRYTSSTNIRKKSQALGQKSLVVFGQTKQIATRITKSDSRIQSVVAKVTGPQQVTLTVKEYPVIGYLYADGGYQQILQSGTILNSKVLNPKDGYPVLKKFKKADVLRRVIKQYRKIGPTIRANINSISSSPTTTNPDRIYIQMSDGNQVYATIDTFGTKMAYYPSITSKLKNKSVIDMEVGAYSYPISQKGRQNNGKASK